MPPRRSVAPSSRWRLMVPLIAAALLVSSSYFLMFHIQITRNNEMNRLDLQDHRFKSQSVYRSGANYRPTQVAETKDGVTTAPKTQFHLVFSTGCNAFQDWQSYTFFYHILTSGQPGDVTRVASGCSDEQGPIMQQVFQEQIAPLSDRFHLHLTPEYGKVVPGEDYKFFNKPMGLRHWFENGLRYPENPSKYDDVIFIILDPDEIVIRPFTQDYTNETMVYHPELRIHTAVTHGKPMAALFAFGAGYMNKIDMKGILGSPEEAAKSPASKWDYQDVLHHYAAGPPYVATGRDMYKIVKTWAEFAIPVYNQTHEHLSEMFAYSVAALHLNMPHQLVESFMLSHTEVEVEGWPLIDHLDDPCTEDLDYNDLPHVLHFCQVYALGPWFFSKYALPTDFLSCQSPLLLLPNASDLKTLHVDYNYGFVHPGKRQPVPRPEVVGRRRAFMICQLTRRLNEAATHWKNQHCSESAANFEQAMLWPHLARDNVWRTLEKSGL